jgi:hypothetical protein
VTDAEVQGDQPAPGYRDVLLDPTETYMCLRCGALVKQDSTDLHDRFHVSVEHPVTRHASGTRSGGRPT